MMIRIITLFLCFVHVPSIAQSIEQGEIIVDGMTVNNMTEAQSRIVDGSTIYLGPGIYNQGIHIKKNNVILSGSQGTHFIDAAIEGKAAIITSGNNITIENIECSEIKVSSANGSCIRHQGENLDVIGVYFHDSEEGILTAKNNGRLFIKYSRFERLGNKGRAHGIYDNSAELLIENCSFLSMLSQGHSIKSRSKKTTIRNTLISTQKGRDSRLIDISNGGELTITHSILHQSNNTVNRQVIGYGLEKMSKERNNQINMVGNLIIMERERGNELIALPKKNGIPIGKNISGNILVGKHIDQEKWSEKNTYYKNRKAAKLADDALPNLSTLPQLLLFLSQNK